MERVSAIKELRQQVTAWRLAGKRIALVPTMGNLHVGHLELVRQARQRADRVVVSIFVNPMQFGAGEDFDHYPRTQEQDATQLERAEADLLFTPPVQEIYPRGQTVQTLITVPGISNILCGVLRPGHFAGVATVVCKLLNMVQPDLALFGNKDLQQLLVIRQMVEDLCVPVEIIGIPTVREPDGLACSSRNGYLTAEERSQAPALYRLLSETSKAIAQGRSDYAALESEGKQSLTAAGFKPDYYSIRNAVDLSEANGETQKLAILAAACLGRTRLIDNLLVERE
ncbi:MAG: pantoate--beta-alanine ligase [Candidatus Polarisedimenticolaceae bacterium]|nr:pantoate--beta-alanine ligase [Candidatus Polarisedimenticolaceae bacterium]